MNKTKDKFTQPIKITVTPKAAKEKAKASKGAIQKATKTKKRT